MFIKKYGDVLTGIFFAILGTAGLIAARALPEPALAIKQTIDSRFFPTLISAVMLVFAVLLFVTSVMALKKENTESSSEQAEAYKPEYNRVAASFIAFAIYCFFMDQIGFLLITIVYLPVQIYLLAPEEKQKKKDIIRYVLIGVVCSAIIYFTFIYGFKIMLPKGLL